MNDRDRVVLPGKMLLPVLIGWLSHAPKWVWGKEPNFERLKKGQGWYDPFAEPDAQRIAAELIVNEMDRLGWKMCQPNLCTTQELLQPPCEACPEVAGDDGQDALSSPGLRGPFRSHPRRR